MAHTKSKANDGKIIYPPGVKEISDKISKEEMVRRLKMVVKTFMDMDQDSEDEKELYLNLALHLASDFFLKHPDKDVRLLVACCLADIFRIYAPEAPYTSPDKLKDIFMFITRQLKGLEDTKSAQFNRYFYLLENIAWVKSYNICFELEDSNDIFTQLYRTLFQVINNGHNQKVHMHMVDLMSSIVCEGDAVSQELLDTVLVNLVPAHKNLNKQAYDLAKALLKRTAQAVEPYITNFFNQVLMLGKTSISDLSEHVFDLILELYNIDSHLLLSVLPQLEFKLKSNDNEERLAVVKLLAKMFGAKDSELASQNKPLWQCYLGRFNDIHVPIRLECVKFASHCLMNHPDLAKDLTEFLKVRSHDPEEAIRHDVIVSIVTAAKKDLSLVNDHLLNFVRERTLDKRWRVRREAMMGLAQIYKKYCLQAEAGKEASKQISWIKDKLLHIYYQNSIDDKLLVERIFAQYMVPHNLETSERMKCLYYLYATLDTNAVKALNEMWKCQNMLRHHVRDLLDLHKQQKSDPTDKAIFSKVMIIAKNLPDPGKAQDFMKKFDQFLEEDERIRSQLDVLVSPNCSCKLAEGCVREITRKLSNPKQPTNPFLEMVKFLLERIAPVHIDTESISALIRQINKSIDGTADDEEEGVQTDEAIRAGLELLKVLSFTHSISFHSAETFESLLQCLKMDDEKVAEAGLQIFRNTGQKIEDDFPHIRSALLPVLQQKAKKGTARQAKHAIHCIHAIFSSKETQFAQIFEPLHKSLDPSNPEQLITPLISIGHIATLAPEQFSAPLKSLVAGFVVKDLLMSDRFPGKKTTKLWVPDDEVGPETLTKIQAMKMMVRWLMGMRTNANKSGTSTLRLLTAILNSDGDLTEQGKISKPDMSRLRLAAGCAVLKLAQEPCYYEIITLEQFQLCALVMNDECYQVRQIFAQKLNKGLAKLRLPLEYMAIFSLCAKDPAKERRAHARQCLVKNINIRREYLKQHAAVSEKLLSLLPEYVVPYIIHLLAHDPDYVKVQDIEQLKDIKECLWFMLEILMSKNENSSHAFIRKMVENIKQTRDVQGPEDPKMNEKLYTVCDVAMNIIITKSTTYSLESPKDPVLPAKYFTHPDKNFNNSKSYLPSEMKVFFTPGKPKATNVLGAVNKPLSSAGKQAQTKTSRMETMSNASSNSNPSSPGRSKVRLDSTEIDHGENEDIKVMKSPPLQAKKMEKREDSDHLRSEIEKPRGRKKGSSAISLDQEDRSSVELLDQVKPVKTSQRGRKRAAHTSESDEQQWPEEKRSKEDLLENEDEQNSPPKKTRRGRPPKATNEELSKGETQGKGGKRGKKRPVSADEEDGDGDNENKEQKQKKTRQPRATKKSQQRIETPESDVNDTLSPESTPQKRRGRPPKTPPTPQTQPKKNFRGARSRQAASRENDSSDMDLRHDSSLENMDITPEVSMDGVNAEEDNQLSTLRVRRKPNKRERR
ncbi:sister chromatid cohesion protein PDS5 homolog B isoform X1 [Leucoraja erinacea]|uniref:sister chromatid cohesion protein PDS5 homolog B isoform X1 n=1 Tax=Leucoraja erinaceus TaxID=7782 RepID=UPI002455C4A0|nr:sister chromatid cohesion protein PDS5 homolog B isoform X1 [Leucoraja erinacea]XP_055492826.1 sister chromatid cohesion protein PDS5 homolog B isoform X1 [Leucoraja erinacea]XP_055492827.1 sister chromatid cohesion protein PDS5 homolog B isoform X1 [Leucoraja erinacea]XP_055492828.1 sister chromatid cohesion protein PDS5 homolog B isoform X1 [Leucoraja erinacea]